MEGSNNTKDFILGNKFEHGFLSNIIIYSLIIVFVIIFSSVYLKLTQSWWFEDDCASLSSINKVTNPIDFFINKEKIATYGAGKALVPFQFFSYWTDTKIFGFSPVACYWHNVISLLSAVLSLYLLLNIFVKNNFASLLVVLSWVLLPSTVAVFQFICARHYIEGLPFACLAILFTYQICGKEEKEDYKRLIAIVFFSLIAMLYKEVYITSLPAFLFLYSLFKKKYKIAAIAVGISLFYLVYRLWAIGLVTDYGGITPLTLKEYPEFFYRLPYTLTVSPGGYFIYLIILSVIILSLWKNKKNIFPIVFFVIIILTALLAIYIVSRPIMYSYQHPGTWYRSVFMLNTILLFFTAYLGIRNCNKYLLSVFFIISLILILPGTNKTKTTWDKMKNLEEKEGKFYIANPDKLLISKANASWSIPGVHTMYGVKNPHYIWAGDIYKNDHSETLLKYDSIWLYHNGKIVNAVGLKENLLKYYTEKFKQKP